MNLLADYIIKNHSDKSITLMSKELGVERKTISNEFEKLVNKGKIKVVKKTLKKHNYVIDKISQKIVKKSTTNNTYNKDETKHKGKQVARQLTIDKITQSNLSGLVATLMETKTYIEKSLLSHYPDMRFLAIERNEKTYNQLKVLVKNESLPIDVELGNMSSFLYGVEENHYAHLLLDYCGILPTIHKELKYTIQNKIVCVGGVIAITIMKPLRFSNDKIIDTLNGFKVKKNNFEGDNRTDIDRSIERYFYSLCGFDYEIELFSYFDSSPMMLILLKRLK